MRKPRTRKAMVEYLTSHFRYSTMNSWNNSTSYATRIKISYAEIDGRSLTREEENACYEMLEVESSFRDSGFNHILREFDKRHNHAYQIWSNGRSGGYLVLGQGGTRPSEHKSVCRVCWQRNYQKVEVEPGQCGRCSAQARYNATFPPDTFANPGRSLDQGEEFSRDEWSIEALRDRVNLVRDFDQTCENALKAYVKYAMKHKVVERTIKVPKKIKVAVAAREKASEEGEGNGAMARG